MTTDYGTTELYALSVADVVLAYPSSRKVMKKYNIDFCCSGHQLLSEACGRAGITPENLLKEMPATASRDFCESNRLTEWNLAFMADYIEENHHKYVKRAIPKLRALLDEICGVHGEDHPVLLEIKDDFEDLSEALLNHLEREEKMVFPAIRRLYRKEINFIEDLQMPHHITMPIDILEEDHNFAGDLIASIRKLSNAYSPPADSCNKFRLLYRYLQEFDDDLMTHIFLENNVLFERMRKNNSLAQNRSHLS